MTCIRRENALRSSDVHDFRSYSQKHLIDQSRDDFEDTDEEDDAIYEKKML